MADNILGREEEPVESGMAQMTGSPANAFLHEVIAFCQAPGQPEPGDHQFNFGNPLLQQLRTSGFTNTSFFLQQWQAYDAQYRREHHNNPPNWATVQRHFVTPFVDTLSNLVFPAGERGGQNYQDFRALLRRWALCQTVFNNLVLHQFTPQQRQLLQTHDWLHLTPQQRTEVLNNVPALRTLAENPQMRQALMDLPTFTREDAENLNRLVRPADAPGGPMPAQLPLEEQQLRRGVEAYIASLPDNDANRTRRDHLRALINRAPGDRSIGDNIELTVYSLIPYIPGANNETFNRMATFALWSYLRTQPNGLMGALSPELRAGLQIHSDDPATRDLILNLVDAARAFQNSANFNADMTTYSTALGLRNMPPQPR